MVNICCFFNYMLQTIVANFFLEHEKTRKMQLLRLWGYKIHLISPFLVADHKPDICNYQKKLFTNF